MPQPTSADFPVRRPPGSVAEGALPIIWRGPDTVLKAESVADSVERQPDDLARAVATVAVGRLGEGVSQLPFLRLVAPLGDRVRDDVIGAAVRADGRTSRRSCRPPVDVLGLFLLRIKRIEKRRVCHAIAVVAPRSHPKLNAWIDFVFTGSFFLPHSAVDSVIFADLPARAVRSGAAAKARVMRSRSDRIVAYGPFRTVTIWICWLTAAFGCSASSNCSSPRPTA